MLQDAVPITPQQDPPAPSPQVTEALVPKTEAPSPAVPAPKVEVPKVEVPKATPNPPATIPSGSEGIVMLLVLAIVALWRVIQSFLDRMSNQNAEMQRAQTEAIASLKDSLTDVKVAVQVSDTNNQTALRTLGHVVEKSVARLDRHEKKLEHHSEALLHTEHRLTSLEKDART